MGIQYIQDADRFLADEEVDWHGATSAADNPSPIAIADDVVSRDHDRDRGGIFRAVIRFVSCRTVCVVRLFVSAALSDISLADFGNKYIGSAWRCLGDS
jgi:hypothetical protein